MNNSEAIECVIGIKHSDDYTQVISKTLYYAKLPSIGDSVDFSYDDYGIEKFVKGTIVEIVPQYKSSALYLRVLPSEIGVVDDSCKEEVKNEQET